MSEYFPIDPEQSNEETAGLQSSSTPLNRWVNDLMNDLHAIAPDATVPAASEQAGPLLKVVSDQIQGANAAFETTAPAVPASSNHADRRAKTFEEQLHSQTQDSDGTLADFKRNLHSAIDAAEVGWQARLDSDLATATKVWNQRLESSIQRGAQRATQFITQRSEEAARQVEEAVDERIGAMRSSLTDASSDAEDRLTVVRKSLDSELELGQLLLDQVSSTIKNLEALTLSTRLELERHTSDMLAWHSQELSVRATQSMAEWSECLITTLEFVGRETIAKLRADLERELSTRLESVQQMLARPESDQCTAQDVVPAPQNRIDISPEPTAKPVSPSLDKLADNSVPATAEPAPAKQAAAEQAPAQPSPAESPNSLAETSPQNTQSTDSAPALASKSEPAPPQDHSASTDAKNPKSNGAKPATDKTVPAIIPAPERRSDRRLKISRTLLVSPINPQYKEEVESTLNASREGVYFSTSAKHFYVGMHLRVILGYTPNDPCNIQTLGEVLRIDPLTDSKNGVALRILAR